MKSQVDPANLWGNLWGPLSSLMKNLLRNQRPVTSFDAQVQNIE